MSARAAAAARVRVSWVGENAEACSSPVWLAVAPTGARARGCLGALRVELTAFPSGAWLCAVSGVPGCGVRVDGVAGSVALARAAATEAAAGAVALFVSSALGGSSDA